MELLECVDQKQGIRDDEQSLAIVDVQGNKYWVRLQKTQVTTLNGKSYIPVGIVGEARDREMTLVELVQETDSGHSRLWVHNAQVVEGAAT